MPDKKITTEYSTHIRIKPRDKKWLKDNFGKEELSSPASFLHYIIQHYRAKN